MAFSVNNGTSKFQSGRGIRKDRPFCTHCKRPGHTMEKCYKLHGFPPDFKSSPKANNVITGDHNSGSNLANVIHDISSSQCQKFMEALSGQMASVNMASVSSESVRIFFSLPFELNLHDKNAWIIDSGATQHICHVLELQCEYSWWALFDIYIHTHTHIYVCIYKYIYIY